MDAPQGEGDSEAALRSELARARAEPLALRGMDTAALNALERSYIEGLRRIRDVLDEREVYAIRACVARSLLLPHALCSSLLLQAEERRCSVCFSDEVRKDTVLVPCGHVFCAGCAAQLSECAICKASIQQRCRAFR
jgi:hypothetical protein